MSDNDYSKIIQDINKSNKKNLIVFSGLATVILVVLGVLSCVIPFGAGMTAAYFVSAALTFCLLFMSIHTHAAKTKSIYLSCVLFMAILLAFGMLLGVYDDPANESTVFIVLLLAVPLLFTMRPLVTDFVILFMSIVFVMTELQVKNPNVFITDTVNVSAFAVISIFVSTFMMRTKILRFMAESENRDLLEMIKTESLTDELTGIGNRKSYEYQFNKYTHVSKNRDFIYVSLDLNGLKTVNDTMGHAAGDELIKGAADCIKQVFSPYGNVYRIGGDEFAAALFINDEKYEELSRDFDRTVSEWEGEYNDHMFIAVGAASIHQYPDASVNELTKIADKLMYTDKGRYYSLKGHERRGRQKANDVILSLYTKILKINLSDDTFQIVSVDESEQTAEMGYDSTISGWFRNFAEMGRVHPDDKARFLEKTDFDNIKAAFAAGDKVHCIFYRRKINDQFKQVMMEIVPVDTYSEHNQEAFLYVKDIEG
ncbi:MAG: GGDEF domain-containing protein [Saccharofermentans sp.]|nr:GGDEF domain-containing protein [Saccharofermentans sp.]